MSGIFMKTNRKIIWLAALFVWCGYYANAQTVAQLTKAGDKSFAEGDYYAAAQYFKDAVNKDEENIDFNYKYAEACRQFNDLQGASAGYRAVIKLDKANQYPLAYFWLAENLRSNCECKCAEAQKMLHRFQTKYRKKDFYYAKAQQEIEACAWVKDHSIRNDSIQIEHLGKEVNTPQSEFNAVHVFPDKIQFSALRNISTDKKSERYLVRIYNQPPTPEPVFIPTGANTAMHIGNGTYSPDSKKFFFTQCEQLTKSNTRCDIYYSKYENFKWTAAEKLSNHVNDPSATNTQPAVGYDLAGNELLFFASNRDGGQGQMDIWMSRLADDGNYEQAVNAGNMINTPGNEVTPFFDVNLRQLFFSSDWHYGFGNFDIFSSSGELTNWSTPQNLLPPINTPQNDLYYTKAIDNSRAYITSNRKGSLFIEAETCCNDIYAYNTGRKIDKRDTDTKKADTLTTVQKQEKTDQQLKELKLRMPAALYFHNDEPDAKTMSDTTLLDYKETYDAYSVLRDEYITEFSKNKTTALKDSAQKQVAQFFETKVDKGYYDLIAFTSQLYDMLQSGAKIEITLKGYCSPLNFNQYNINLGYRRVASLRNYFFHYRNSILLPYVSNGQLTLKTESFGEETANKQISDSRKDVQQSVYSPTAALERRVEIISVELK